MVYCGLDNFLADRGGVLSIERDERCGYLSNQASVTYDLVQGRIPLQGKLGRQLTTLFSPQHGFFSEKQDNMVESAHGWDAVCGLPIFSLYGEQRKPTEEMLTGLDTLLIDLVDVGTRVYTFIYTLAYCLEAAAEFGKRVIVFDRPNPIGGVLVEGNILQADCASFVGLYPLPMRHGMTIGELALMFNREFAIGAELEVVPLDGWKREMLAIENGVAWVAPSPNMPTVATAQVYPGQVIWEGTQVSEGRGTTQPFEFVGAPYWHHQQILDFLKETELPGCFLRPVAFEPTSGKYAGQRCVGFQIHVTDSTLFRPYRMSLALLQAVMLLYPDEFSYKQPPYEYEFTRLPMDLILGDSVLRKRLEQGEAVTGIEAGWQAELQEFLRVRKRYLLY